MVSIPIWLLVISILAAIFQIGWLVSKIAFKDAEIGFWQSLCRGYENELKLHRRPIDNSFKAQSMKEIFVKTFTQELFKHIFKPKTNNGGRPTKK